MRRDRDTSQGPPRARPRFFELGTTKTFPLFLLLLLGLGLVARIVPLFDAGRVLEQFPTEDGYFMLMIGRNLAVGNGFSIAGGAIPTNGTQPLITLLWSLGFLIVGGERQAGVLVAQVAELAISLASAYALYRLGLSILRERARAAETAALAACTWFASPLVIPHSMNCLETGAYGLVAIAVALCFVETGDREGPSAPANQKLWVGVLLGLAFWVRNDSVFLIAAACLTYVFRGVPFGMPITKSRFRRTLVFGSISVLVASPWLIYNYVGFGHIMPVSGRAEALTRHAGGNLLDLFPTLLEYALAIVPIPERFEAMKPVAIACAVALALLVTQIPRLWRAARAPERSIILLVTMYGAGLASFYGFYFGAGWFMSRYLFPLSPFLTLLWAVLVVRAVVWLSERKLAPLVYAAGLGIFVIFGGLHARFHRIGAHHAHFQVVRWIESNVAPEIWVGAIQTGTLGFFHDRTINLDGKVNVAAYEAIRDGRIDEYVAAGQIEYLADWLGMVDWLDKPALEDQFQIEVRDLGQNLGVLRRGDRRAKRLVHRDQPALKAARAALETAVEEAEAALAASPDDSARLHDVWRAQLGLARQRFAAGDAREATAGLERALELATQLAERAPLDPRARLARAETAAELGRTARAAVQLERATQAYQLARDVYETLAASPTAPWMEALAQVHDRLAELSRLSGDLDAATKSLERSLVLRASALATRPDDVEVARAVTVSQISLADVALRRGAIDEARRQVEAALATRIAHAKEAPSDSRTLEDLAVAHMRAASVARAAGNAEEERAAIARAAEVRAQRVERDARTSGAGRLQRALALGAAARGSESNSAGNALRSARALMSLGQNARAQGDLPAARAAFAAAVAALEDDGASPDVSRAALRALGEAELAAGRHVEALRAFRASIAQTPEGAPWRGVFDDRLGAARAAHAAGEARAAAEYYARAEAAVFGGSREAEGARAKLEAFGQVLEAGQPTPPNPPGGR